MIVIDPCSLPDGHEDENLPYEYQLHTIDAEAIRQQVLLGQPIVLPALDDVFQFTVKISDIYLEPPSWYEATQFIGCGTGPTPEAEAAISLVSGNLWAVIFVVDDTMIIENLAEYEVPSPPPNTYVTYSASRAREMEFDDAPPSPPDQGGAAPAMGDGGTGPMVGRTLCTPVEPQDEEEALIFVGVDDEFIAKYGSPGWLAEVDRAIGAVAGYFAQQTPLVLKVRGKGIVSLDKSGGICDVWAQVGNRLPRNEMQSNMSTVFVYEDLDGIGIGCADESAFGTPPYEGWTSAIQWKKDLWIRKPGSLYQRTLIVYHELGHNHAATHEQGCRWEPDEGVWMHKTIMAPNPAVVETRFSDRTPEQCLDKDNKFRANSWIDLVGW